MRKRVKVEFQDEEGTKYTLAVEGRLSREKVMKVMDLMDLMDNSDLNVPEMKADGSTSFGRVQKLIEVTYSAKEFSSADIAKDYEEQHNEPVKLSTISTYLSRLVERGYLRRQRFGNSWVYRRVFIPETQLPLK